MKISTSTSPIPVNISMNDEDIESIDNVLGNLRTLCNWLDKYEINGIISDSTGEVIDTYELRRVRGILDGLANQPHWHGTANG